MKKMTQQDFDRLLDEVLSNESPQTLLSIPGVYECLAEEFNNQIHDLWEEEQRGGL